MFNSSKFETHSKQVHHCTSPVIPVSHASLFVGLVLAWRTSPLLNMETLTRMTISRFHTCTHKHTGTADREPALHRDAPIVLKKSLKQHCIITVSARRWPAAFLRQCSQCVKHAASPEQLVNCIGCAERTGHDRTCTCKCNKKNQMR